MKLTVIIGALVIALFAVLAIGNFFGDKQSEREIVMSQAPQPIQPQIAQRNILVARQDIPIGTSIDAALYDIKPVAEHLVPPGAVIADDPNQAKIDGMITNTSLVTNQPILTSMLRNPNDPGYIAGQLPEGMRAVTIQVGLTESLAGLISPGDKVDVLYSHDLTSFNVDSAALKSLKADSSEAEKTASVSIAEVLIPNLKILAVDKKVGGGATAEEQQAGAVFNRATIIISALVAAVMQELVEQLGLGKSYPLVVAVDDEQRAQVALKGGLGHVPIVLTGLKAPNSHRVLVNGQPITHWQTDWDAAAQRWRIVFPVEARLGKEFEVSL